MEMRGGGDFFLICAMIFLWPFYQPSGPWISKSVFGAVTLFELTVSVRAFQVTAICSL